MKKSKRSRHNVKESQEEAVTYAPIESQPAIYYNVDSPTPNDLNGNDDCIVNEPEYVLYDDTDDVPNDDSLSLNQPDGQRIQRVDHVLSADSGLYDELIYDEVQQTELKATKEPEIPSKALNTAKDDKPTQTQQTFIERYWKLLAPKTKDR